MPQVNSTNTNYTRSSNPTMMTSTAKAVLNGKISSQKLSTYKPTATDNLGKQGVGVTRVGVTSPNYSNTPIKSAIQGKMYPVSVVNKARAKMGYNSNVGVGGK